MKFVGKTSVAVIKSAILGAFANELFWEGKRARSRQEEEREKKATCAPPGPLDPSNCCKDNLGSID